MNNNFPVFNESVFDVQFSSELKGHTIGIDVAHVISTFKEYQPLVEVLPREFLDNVIQLTDFILGRKKKVILMFDGLLPDDQQRAIITTGLNRLDDNTTPAKLKIRTAKSLQNITPMADTMSALFMALVRQYRGNNSVTVMKAPYYAWSQLAILLHENQIGDVFGPLEMFAFANVQRVLLSFLGAEVGEMGVVTQQEVRQAYNNSRSPTDIVLNYSPHRYIAQQPPFILFSPVYSYASGEINCQRLDAILPPQSPPLDTRSLAQHFGVNIWSTHKELMVQMSTGVLPIPLVRAIVMEKVHQTFHFALSSPFNTDEALGPIYPAFCQSLSFMYTLLTQIEYQILDKLQIRTNQNHPPEIKLDEWMLEHWQPNHLPHWLTYLDIFGTKATQDFIYKDSVAVHLSVKLKVLDLMGYFTHPMNSDNPDDSLSGLSSFATALHKCKTVNACAGILFIEACRTRLLNDQSLLVTPTRELDVLPTEEMRLAILGARIMSLINLNRSVSTPAPQSPWNLNIIAFSNLARLSFNVLQQLNLVMAFVTFRGRKFADVNNEKIFENLVLNHAPTPHMGFVAYTVFSAPPEQPMSMARLSQLYPDASNLEEDLKDAAAFFYTAYEMVQVINEDDSNIPGDQTERIKLAYHFCSERLRAIQGANFEEVCPDRRGYSGFSN